MLLAGQALVHLRDRCMAAATPPVVSRRLGEQAPMQLSCILEVKPGLDEPVHPVSLILFFVPSWTLMHMGVVRGNDNKIYNNQNMCFALTGSHPNTCVSSAMGYRYAPLEPGSILSVAIMAGLGNDIISTQCNIYCWRYTLGHRYAWREPKFSPRNCGRPRRHLVSTHRNHDCP